VFACVLAADQIRLASTVGRKAIKGLNNSHGNSAVLPPYLLGLSVSRHQKISSYTQPWKAEKLLGITRSLVFCRKVIYKKTSKYNTYFLTPWSRVLLEQLTGFQLFKKFPAYYGTRRFTTAITSSRHLSLSRVSSI